MKNNLMIKAFTMLFIFIIGMVGYICYYRGIFDNNIEEDAISEKDIQNQLDKFINAASIYSETGYFSTAQAFFDGTNKIDNDRAVRIWESDGNINFIINE